jgi:hypothetical protein
MSEIKLKPCPFCGEKKWVNDGLRVELVHKEYCFMTMPNNMRKTILYLDDIKYWNRRAETEGEKNV